MNHPYPPNSKFLAWNSRQKIFKTLRFLQKGTPIATGTGNFVHTKLVCAILNAEKSR